MSLLLRTVGPLLAGLGEVFPITLGTCYVDSTATAMTWIEGVDLSPFAGVAGSRKKVIFSDGSKELVAWIDAAGGGYTLGPEMLNTATNRDSPYNFDTFTVSGKDITQAIALTTSTRLSKSNATELSTGKLFEARANLTLSSGTAPALWTTLSTGSLNRQLFSVLSAGANAIISNFTSTDRGLGFRSAAVTDFAAVVSLKTVTDCAATGVHLYTDKTGSTRGITSDGGINLRAVTSVEVRNA